MAGDSWLRAPIDLYRSVLDPLWYYETNFDFHHDHFDSIPITRKVEKIEQEQLNMRRGLWFNMTTILGFACLTLCVWQSPIWSEDTPASEAAKPAAAGHETHAADHKPAERAESHDAHAEDHADGHAAGGQKGPMDWSTDLALWTLITFFVFLIVLKAVAWKPLMSALEARETGIFSNVENANKARAEAEKAFADYQAKLQKAEDEVRQILAEARKAAENARADMLASTQKEVSTMKDRALAEIDQVRVQALEELFKHMASTVTKATEQVIKRSLTPADQDRLVSDAVSQFAKR